MMVTKRAGRLSVVLDGATRRLATLSDVFNLGESGLMGLAVDPEFASNRRIYTCYA